MARKEHRENTHHLISRSNHKQYNVEIPQNKLRMDMTKHNALHALFQVLLTPKEQLRGLRDIYDTILNDTSKQLFDELLSLSDEEFYIKEAIKKPYRSLSSKKHNG